VGREPDGKVNELWVRCGKEKANPSSACNVGTFSFLFYYGFLICFCTVSCDETDIFFI
jgi:hypothetical protein